MELSISERSFNRIIKVHVCARMVDYVRTKIDLTIYEMGGADAELLRRYFIEEIIPWHNLVYHKLWGNYKLCHDKLCIDVVLTEISKDFSELTFCEKPFLRKGAWVVKHTGHGFYRDKKGRTDITVQYNGQ